MLACALVSQSVKYETLCFSVTCGKLVSETATFEILEGEIRILCLSISILWNTFLKEGTCKTNWNRIVKLNVKPYDTFLEKLKHRCISP